MLDAAQIAGLNCLRLMNETTAGWYGWRSLGTGFGRFLQVSNLLLEAGVVLTTIIIILHTVPYSCIGIWDL